MLDQLQTPEHYSAFGTARASRISICCNFPRWSVPPVTRSMLIGDHNDIKNSSLRSKCLKRSTMLHQWLPSTSGVFWYDAAHAYMYLEPLSLISLQEDRLLMPAISYLLSSPRYLCPEQCTLWIRPSTGSFSYRIRFHDHSAVLEPTHDAQIVASMSLSDYHYTCFARLSLKRSFSIPTHSSVTLGAVTRLPGPDNESSMEVAFIPHCPLRKFNWA
ncbi:hypothetical protein FB451DRAFT_282420 [Mycena latifolia]|nr:hypothetical protein FB451DRAFT_282420 [Mycena latifolia]